MKNSCSSKFHPRTREPPNDHNRTRPTIGAEHRVSDGGDGAQDDEEEAARCEWDFSLSTVVSSSTSSARGRSTTTRTMSDALGVIEFDQSDTMIATGGIARKIRIYNFNSLLPCDDDHEGPVLQLDHATACDYYMCTPAKLSSLRWKPGSGGQVLGSGDYDGVVMEYDLEKRVPTFERDEHGGRRVWSVDYSHWDPVLGASGSDDGTMQIWDPRCEGGECVAKVRPIASGGGGAVCCVEFNPFDGSMVTVGCTDRRVYGYDVRMMVEPVLALDGHGKTVTYVKFLDSLTLVSAGADGCLKLWNLDGSTSSSRHLHAIRTYKGHTNSRNFVGLSVWRNGGLLGCGSENNQVYVYDKRWGKPIWVHGFEPVGRGGDGHGFVNSVCWRQVGEDQCTLVAGGSDGVLKVFRGKRKVYAH